MVYLHTANASGIIIENIHVLSTLNWRPLQDRLRFAHLQNLNKIPWWSVFCVTTRASEAIRVDKIHELFIASRELELNAAFLAVALENAI